MTGFSCTRKILENFLVFGVQNRASRWLYKIETKKEVLDMSGRVKKVLEILFFLITCGTTYVLSCIMPR